MKSSIGIFALGLAASVAAHEHAHGRFHQLRAVASTCNVTYVTVTSYGEWKLVPETSTSSSAVATSSSKAAPPPPPPTSSAVPTTSSTSTSSSTPPPPPPTTSSTPPPPPPSYSAPATTSVEQKQNYNNNPVAAAVSAVNSWVGGNSNSNSGSSGSISSNGNQWAFCYTPYASSGACKDSSTVNSDIASLKGKGFTTIRTYANDCSGVQNIAQACKNNGLKLILGIDLAKGKPSDSDLSNYMSPVKDSWSIVEMVVVGNEAIFAGQISASDLASYISHVKGQFSGAGYNGPVTTTEPLGTIQQYGSTICPAVDVIAANIHPFFNGGISASGAGDFVKSQLNDLAKVCSGSKQAYCLETGWPSGGSNNAVAIPGFDTQKAAVSGIMSAVGGKVAMFSFEDDTWKAPGQWGVEQKWGSAHLFN